MKPSEETEFRSAKAAFLWASGFVMSIMAMGCFFYGITSGHFWGVVLIFPLAGASLYIMFGPYSKAQGD